MVDIWKICRTMNVTAVEKRNLVNFSKEVFYGI